jgi:hypothetical protein
MNTYTFKITVTDSEAGSEPMSAKDTLDYILLRLESQSVLKVTKAEKVGV